MFPVVLTRTFDDYPVTLAPAPQRQFILVTKITLRHKSLLDQHLQRIGERIKCQPIRINGAADTQSDEMGLVVRALDTPGFRRQFQQPQYLNT